MGVAIDHAVVFVPQMLRAGAWATVWVEAHDMPLGALAKWAVGPTMPLFFMVAGAVSSPEPSRESRAPRLGHARRARRAPSASREHRPRRSPPLRPRHSPSPPS
eukprot:4499979-Prymnesium_polylepis.1